MGRRIDGRISAKQIAGLDGLRGIAILGVIGYHLAPHAVPGGFLGATLFTAQFLAPDTLRGIRHEVLSIFSGSNNWWQLAQNASYFTRITGTSPFTHLWSLAVEMQFYLLWPALFLGYSILKRRRRSGTCLFILLILASMLAMFLRLQPEGDNSRVYYGSDTRVFALLIGGLSGLRPKQPRGRRRGNSLLRTAGFILLLTGFLWLYFTADGESVLTYWLILVPSACMASRLIVLCADKSLPFGRWLDCPPLRWLGKRSYELYLVQYPVFFFVRRQKPAGSELWNTLIALALILLIAQWLYQTIQLLQIKTRSKTYEKTTIQNTGIGLAASGGDYCGGGDRSHC